MRIRELWGGLEAFIRAKRRMDQPFRHKYQVYSEVPHEFHPDAPSECFRLPFFPLEDIEVLGEANSAPGLVGDYLMPVHPALPPPIPGKRPSYYRLVAPMASTRTLIDLDSGGAVFWKVSAPWVISRRNRALTKQECAEGIQFTRIMTTALDSHRLPPRLAILREPAALWSEIHKIGSIIRTFAPYPERQDRRMFPFFALYSRDQTAPEDPCLLEQLLTDLSPSISERRRFVIENLGMGAVEALLLVFQATNYKSEPHAENLLVEIDNRLSDVRLVLRDSGRFRLQEDGDNYLDLAYRFDYLLGRTLQTLVTTSGHILSINPAELRSELRERIKVAFVDVLERFPAGQVITFPDETPVRRVVTDLVPDWR